jgi:HK97 family phage major capsid protein
MSDLNKLVTDLASTFQEFKVKNDERIAQIEKSGTADGLLTEQVEKLSARVDELRDKKESLEKTLGLVEAQMSRKGAADTGESSTEDQKAQKFYADVCKARGLAPVETYSAADLRRYKSAFVEHMRKGDNVGLDAMKALSVGSDPDGGYTVDPDTTGRIVQKIFETSPMRSVASVQVIGTDALEGLFDLDETAAGWVGETGARTTTNTPQLGRWRIPVHELYANPAATQKVLDDSFVNLEAWLADKVADKFTRIENDAFVNGNGVGKPRGFLTYGAGTTLPGTIEQKVTGAAGGFLTNGAGGDCLIDLMYTLKQAYRSGARWFMPRAVVAQIRKIKDSDGMYIWQPGIAAGQPSTILGFPVIEMEDMPAPVDGSLSAAFGNMGEAYQIVDRQGIRVLRDPYTNKPYVHFYTVKRTGGDVINFEAIKILKFATA